MTGGASNSGGATSAAPSTNAKGGTSGMPGSPEFQANSPSKLARSEMPPPLSAGQPVASAPQSRTPGSISPNSERSRMFARPGPPVHPTEATGPGCAALAPWESDCASTNAADLARLFLLEAPKAESDRVALIKTLRDQRERALRWVAQIPTRNGNDRTDRIRSCGWMELCYRPSDGAVGWRSRFCKDRACPCCAINRAREVQAQLRQYLVKREQAGIGPMLFVTFTHPKFAVDRESPGQAVTRVLKEWAKFRVRRPFRKTVAGYVRAVECVFLRRGWRKTKAGRPYFVKETGWHAHLHIAIELKGDHACPIRWQAWAKRAWVEICGGDPKGQDFQDLTSAKLGQIAKYITKPFELPEEWAPIFFQEMAGRRIIQGGGVWADFTKEVIEEGAEGWVPQACHVAQLMDDAKADKSVCFRWVENGDGELRTAAYIPVRDGEIGKHVQMPAREALRRLMIDGRSVTKRKRKRNGQAKEKDNSQEKETREDRSKTRREEGQKSA